MMDDGEGTDGGSHPPRASSNLTLEEQTVGVTLALASQNVVGNNRWSNVNWRCSNMYSVIADKDNLTLGMGMGFRHSLDLQLQDREGGGGGIPDAFSGRASRDKGTCCGGSQCGQ